jgi:hypothetical protein
MLATMAGSAVASVSVSGTNANAPDDVITSSRGCALLAFLVVPAEVPVFLLRDLLAIGTPTAAWSCSLGIGVEGTHYRRANAADETAPLDGKSDVHSCQARRGSSLQRTCVIFGSKSLFLRHHHANNKTPLDFCLIFHPPNAGDETSKIRPA